MFCGHMKERECAFMCVELGQEKRSLGLGRRLKKKKSDFKQERCAGIREVQRVLFFVSLVYCRRFGLSTVRTFGYVADVSFRLLILFYLQIFYPETTDIYDRKNMPRCIYCIHALR